MNEKDTLAQIKTDEKMNSRLCRGCVAIGWSVAVLIFYFHVVYELPLTTCVCGAALLAITVPINICTGGENSKPGSDIDPLRDPRPPFVASWSFTQKDLTHIDGYDYRETVGETGVSVYQPETFIINSIDRYLYMIGRMILVGEVHLERKAENTHRDFITVEEWRET